MAPKKTSLKAVTNEGNDKPTNLLTAEDFFSSAKPKLVTLTTIPGQVYLRPLPAGDVLDFMEQRQKNLEPGASQKGNRSALMRLISRAVVHEDGKPMFSEENMDRLNDIPVLVFNEISGVVLEAAGIVVGVGAEESEGKGSSAPSTTASSTVSPST
jgi:hypothetical protein